MQSDRHKLPFLISRLELPDRGTAGNALNAEAQERKSCAFTRSRLYSRRRCGLCRPRRDPEFSPDGRWLTCQSNEPGKTEVYARAFLPPISGRELMYRSGDQIIAAPKRPSVIEFCFTSHPSLWPKRGAVMGVHAPKKFIAPAPSVTYRFPRITAAQTSATLQPGKT